MWPLTNDQPLLNKLSLSSTKLRKTVEKQSLKKLSLHTFLPDWRGFMRDSSWDGRGWRFMHIYIYVYVYMYISHCWIVGPWIKVADCQVHSLNLGQVHCDLGRVGKPCPKEFPPQEFNIDTLQRTNISHLGKKDNHLQECLGGDMLVLGGVPKIATSERKYLLENKQIMFSIYTLEV